MTDSDRFISPGREPAFGPYKIRDSQGYDDMGSLRRKGGGRCANGAFRWVFCALMIVLSGCSYRSAAPLPERSLHRPEPLQTRLANDSKSVIGHPNRSYPDDKPVSGALTLERALTLVLENSPTLQAARSELSARDAEILQARLLPNPVLTTTVDNFAGSGSYSNFRNSETTVELSQLIELGGDRAARVQYASASKQLAAWDYKASERAVLTAASARFIDVMADQSLVSLAQKLLDTAQKINKATGARVAAGAASPVDLSRTQILVARARARLRRYTVTLSSDRQRLAVLWGASDAQFSRVVGSFSGDTTVPTKALVTPYLDSAPALARWTSELAARRSGLELAKAQAVPDLTVGLGGRQFQSTGDSGIVATASIPLSIFDRNQGNVAAAGHRITEATYKQRQAGNRVRSAFEHAYGQLLGAANELESLNAEVLPQSRSVFEAISTGYRQGKFDLLKLLDAQRALVEAQLGQVQTRATFLKAKNEIEGLIGRRLNTLNAESSAR